MAEKPTTGITVVEPKELMQVCDNLYSGISEIINSARQKVAVFVNANPSNGGFVSGSGTYQYK